MKVSAVVLLACLVHYGGALTCHTTADQSSEEAECTVTGPAVTKADSDTFHGLCYVFTTIEGAPELKTRRISRGCSSDDKNTTCERLKTEKLLGTTTRSAVTTCTACYDDYCNLDPTEAVTWAGEFESQEEGEKKVKRNLNEVKSSKLVSDPRRNGATGPYIEWNRDLAQPIGDDDWPQGNTREETRNGGAFRPGVRTTPKRRTEFMATTPQVDSQEETNGQEFGKSENLPSNGQNSGSYSPWNNGQRPSENFPTNNGQRPSQGFPGNNGQNPSPGVSGGNGNGQRPLENFPGNNGQRPSQGFPSNNGQRPWNGNNKPGGSTSGNFGFGQTTIPQVTKSPIEEGTDTTDENLTGDNLTTEWQTGVKYVHTTKGTNGNNGYTKTNGYQTTKGPMGKPGTSGQGKEQPPWGYRPTEVPGVVRPIHTKDGSQGPIQASATNVKIYTNIFVLTTLIVLSMK